MGVSHLFTPHAASGKKGGNLCSRGATSRQQRHSPVLSWFGLGSLGGLVHPLLTIFSSRSGPVQVAFGFRFSGYRWVSDRDQERLLLIFRYQFSAGWTR